MRRYKELDRKYKEVKTTELLDFIGIEFDYKKDKERDKQQDYRDELEHREPFQDFKRKINQQEERIKALEEAVKRLMVHKHDNAENVVIPIEKGTDWRYFR